MAIFGKKSSEDSAVPAQLPGRNDPCHCGSGKKYKKCCEAKDEAKSHAQHEKSWDHAEKEFEKQKKEAEKAATDSGAAPAAPGIHTKPSMSSPHASKHSVIPAPKFNMPRKTGGGG